MLDKVLLIDDDETDHFFFKRLVSKTDLINEVLCFQYADEALEYLQTTDRPKNQCDIFRYKYAAHERI